LVGSVSSYFSNHYGTVVDDGMIQNFMETDSSEIFGLASYELIPYLFFAGLLPVLFLLRWPIPFQSFRQECGAKLLVTSLSVLLALIAVAPFTAEYASFLREFKPVRYLTTPITPLYSGVRFAFDRLESLSAHAGKPKSRFMDDHVERTVGDTLPRMFILVVGETARADHFSLNGYPRATNPLLQNQPYVVSLPSVSSCGTSTSVSVPCMFSADDRRHFSKGSIYQELNVLDVLARNDVAVVWRDNNSSSKGVADRVEYQSFRDARLNPVCDAECRDEGLLDHLEFVVADHPGQDIFLVLHTMGSHGPEYYKRYPDAFEVFTPTCKTNLLSECSREEIENAYDNSILYADFVINSAIEKLKGYQGDFRTSLLYLSDHGESLGEGHVYLHGLPYAFAPESQTHVAAIAWIPPSSNFDLDRTREAQMTEYSHDDLFCTVLLSMDVRAKFCHKMPTLLKRAT
ncbi:MAG: phosphoethanolamine--lipid A transferase, partial [Congregibacter sp.]|nr:phosphoethanolamine--lipid A transferase [Congregibacter sp.]